MNRLVASTLTLALFAPTAAFAAVSCPDRAPAAINASANADVVKCQTTIAKVASKFVQTKLATMAKCHLKQPAGSCPGLKDTQKIEKEALKDADAIVKACPTAVAAGLTSAYASQGVAPADIASCTLSQHNAVTSVLDGELHGASITFPFQTKQRDKCAQTISKSGTKYQVGAMKAVNGCLAKQMKLGTLVGLSPACVGSYAGGAFVPPTDPITADKLAKLVTKTQDAIAKDCAAGEGPLATGFIHTIFACDGASTVQDLQNCVICNSDATNFDLLEQQNSETGTFVANGAGALQTAVTAAAVNTKLLIQSGDYAEQVIIPYTTDGIQLVGCGSATNARPRLVPPAGPGPFDNGITNTCTTFDPMIPEACTDGVDNVLFQSLEVFNFDANGIRMNGSNGITFRDVVGDGNHNSEYAVFPVHSNNVLVEATTVHDVTDAGIYVGQSTNIVVRYNLVHDNVAGIEIENSDNARVHDNFTTHNTGGLLVFKLPGPPLQISNNHYVFHNVSVDNNTPNFGAPGSTVGVIPDGTGYLVLSNDDSEFAFNMATGNGSFGFAFIDQKGVNDLSGMQVFNPTSPDQKATNNVIHYNYFVGNGGSPDTTPPNNTPIAADIAFFLDESANHNDCFFSNGGGTMPNLGVSSMGTCF